MALDPAWFNALVDDTGSGTTGTVWNKAAIAGLLTNINSEIARLNYDQNLYTPIVRAVGGGGGTAAYTTQTGWYARVAQHLTWCGFRVTFSKGSLGAGPLEITVPFPAANVGGANFGGIAIPFFSGLATPVSSLGSYSNGGWDGMTLVYVAGAGGTGIINLTGADLGAGTIDLIGGGTYCSA